jgi:hypothetical protein
MALDFSCQLASNPYKSATYRISKLFKLDLKPLDGVACSNFNGKK